MKLILGNKTYSSWSLRPWIAAKAARIPFEEEIIWLRHADTSARIRAYSPHGKVPILIDGSIVVFESIAILEYLAELAPRLWPADRAARAFARSICAEMHAGFVPLRNACPMTLKREPRPTPVGDTVRADVERIVTIFSECRGLYGAGGEFLFGADFTNADAMYAPVINRLHAYAFEVPSVVRRYMDAVMATPMWQEWASAASLETEIVADTDEVP